MPTPAVVKIAVNKDRKYVIERCALTKVMITNACAQVQINNKLP
jgi:hypothetical protein